MIPLFPETEAILRDVNLRILRTWPAPPRRLISEWARENRIIPVGASNRPGKWVSEPYQDEIMDAMLDPEVREVICKKSTQIGWSDGILNNIVGYHIAHDPKPMMLVQPSETTAKDYSKLKIAPMIAACPALAYRVRENVSRRGGNTIQLKEFDGGFLKVNGTTPKQLRSHAVAMVLFDEVDAYELDVDGEGDPIEIGTRRTDTWDESKILKGSTPAKPKGLSQIDAAYERSDQRMFYVPCPHCRFMQALIWRDPETKEFRLVWAKDKDGAPVPESVEYVCVSCRKGIPERFKHQMLARGRWIPKFPERKSIRGYYINALYSPWKDLWPDLALEWFAATSRNDSEKLKAFINLRLGETWEEQGEHIEASMLAARKEDPTGTLAKDCAVLVGAIDVQANRLECQILGFGAGEEAWIVKHEIFWGDPGVQIAGADVWSEADAFILRPWKHVSGAELRPAIVFVDSGDQADAVYDFVEPRQHAARRVFAIKGVDYIAKPGLVAEGTTQKSRIRLFTVATNAAKDRIFSRLTIPTPGPGYIHIPGGDEGVTDEYLQQLTGEKKITVKDKRTRRSKRLYVKTYNRNEALDLTVYGFAALFALQTIIDPGLYRDLGLLSRKMNETGQNPAAWGQNRVRRYRSRGLES